MSATLLNVQVRAPSAQIPTSSNPFRRQISRVLGRAHTQKHRLALNWELVHVSSPATVKNPVVHRCWIRPVCDGRYVIGGHTEN